MALVRLLLVLLWCHNARAADPKLDNEEGRGSERLLPVSFPSKEDTLAYVDALKHSNFSQWRSLEEVAKKAGGGSCTGALNTSVLTALYLLGLFNLCAASPASCCVPSLNEERRRKRSDARVIKEDDLPPLLNSLTQNLSSLPLEQFDDLPQVTTSHGGKVPVHISVVEQVRKLWDSNPRLLSDLPCTTATEAVRSSFISLSGVASGIILAYSIAQLNQCYPDHEQENGDMNKIWFFPIPKQQDNKDYQYLVRSLPPEIPVEGDDERDDNCERSAVQMANGSCERLLSSRACPYMQWVLLNRETGKGECFLRLCSEGKVFVERDQLCHNVREPGFCPENQRLYLTAWGEAVCDCDDGMFYGPDKKCHRIFEQGYCYKGTVLQFHKPSKTLVCKTDHCQKLNNLLPQHELPYVKSKDNSCYQFGSTGPCEESEQYGFNIEELEPSCVSLEEAGLIRSHRSYQYSHMSFPSFPDKDFPHYEVSYVILNGSTWELMMRTVGRQRRDIAQDKRHKNDAVISFIDTRDFPKSLEDISRKFQGLQRDDILQLDKAVARVETPLMLYERIRNIRLSKLNEISRSNLFHQARSNGTQKGNMKLINVLVNHKHMSELGSDYNGTKVENEKFDEANESHSINVNSSIDFVESEVTNSYSNITEENEIQNKTHVHTKEKRNGILVKVLPGKPNPCKWEIGFLSQMPNTSILYNSSSINILSHPNLASFRVKNYEEGKKINFEQMNSSEDLTDQKKVIKEIENDNIGSIEESSNHSVNLETNTNAQLPNVIEENTSSTVEIPFKLFYSKIVDKVVNITSSTSNASNSAMKFTHEKEVTRSIYLNRINVSSANEIVTILNNTSLLESNVSTTQNLRTFINNTLHDRIDPATVRNIVSDTNKMQVNEHVSNQKETNISEANKNDKIEISVNLSENLPINEANEEIVAEESNRLTMIEENEPADMNKNETKSEQQIIEVSQEITSTESPTKRDILIDQKHAKKPKRRKNKKKKRRKSKIQKKKKRKKTDNKDISDKNQIKTDWEEDIIVEKISQAENQDLGTQHSFRNIFRNQSLPDYLRNRGRRQAGNRKGLRLGPGIINAPLLNQCRPGAKRDYNGYCRPKVIPSARLPSRKHAKSKYFEPTPPRMKCKGDKRLDSRGICRVTFSGLG